MDQWLGLIVGPTSGLVILAILAYGLYTGKLRRESEVTDLEERLERKDHELAAEIALREKAQRLSREAVDVAEVAHPPKKGRQTDA